MPSPLAERQGSQDDEYLDFLNSTQIITDKKRFSEHVSLM